MYEVLTCAGGSLPVFRISGSLTIYVVADARHDLERRLEPHSEAALDLAGIQELDTAGVQLLQWLLGEAKRNSRRLELVNPSPVALELYTLLHLPLPAQGGVPLTPTAA